MKIENWSRNKEYEGNWSENKDVIRCWENDNDSSIAYLFKEEREEDNLYTFAVNDLEKFIVKNDQEFARKKASDWMRNHPKKEPEELKGKKLHRKLLEVGREVESKKKLGGVANELNKNDIRTIVSTVNFFDNTKGEIATKQTLRDLAEPYKYRVFDWLGMMQDRDWESKSLNWLFDKLARIYIQERSVEGFVQALRQRDLQVEAPFR